MKDNSLINRAFKALKKLFQPKVEKPKIWTPTPRVEIPKHESKVYHNPPCSGIAKGASKKRRAKTRQQKRSRIINRKAS